MNKTYPLEASYDDYQRRLEIVSREAAAKRESIMGVRTQAIARDANSDVGLNELKSVNDWERRMEEDLATGPHGAKALRDGNQLTDYSFARKLARERGRYPEKKPFNPSLDDRRAREQWQEESLDLPPHAEEDARQRAFDERFLGAKKLDGIPGLLVPKPRPKPERTFDPSDYEDEY